MTTFLSQFAKITDHLFLSSFVGATEHNVIKNNVKCVISICKDVPKYEKVKPESIQINVLDKPTESLSRYFDLLADKIHDTAKRNGVSLVHCVAGVSRSATIVIVYLMKHLRFVNFTQILIFYNFNFLFSFSLTKNRMTLKEAHNYVKSRRPFIRPNLGFWQQLVDYEYRLFKFNSVKLIASNIGPIPDIYENEVRTMQWMKDNNHSAQYQQNQQNNNQYYATPKKSNNQPEHNKKFIQQHQPENHHPADLYEMTLKQAKGEVMNKLNNNNSYYTTTYRSSYSKPKYQ
jgi:atypical dual specificity phosphatase